MSTANVIVSACISAGLLASTAGAVNIETVPVGNPGNAGELSGGSDGVPPRICGAVNYRYNIGKYEVTAGQYTAFLNAVGGVDTYALYDPYMAIISYGGCGITRSGGGTVGDPYTYAIEPDAMNRPVNRVDWGDAARFSNWLHNGQPTGPQGLSTTEDGSYYLNGATSDAALLAVTRKPGATWVIPSEDEWYKAAYHKNDGVTGNYWDYPMRSDAVPGQDTLDVSGNNANFWTPPYAWPIDPPYYTTVGGEFQNSASPYGTFDQCGNVWEWNESILYGYARGVLGACFGDTEYMLGAWNRNVYDYPTFEDYGTGFRVSQVPEPAAIVIWVLAGLGILRRLWGFKETGIASPGTASERECL